MILTCPACGTQYVVKDGAIPPGGRQVRCASCRHSWHQDPEETDAADAGDPGEPLAQPGDSPSEVAIGEAAPTIDPDRNDVAAERVPNDVGAAETLEHHGVEEEAPAASISDADIADDHPAEPRIDHSDAAEDDFTPFAAREERRKRGSLGLGLVAAFGLIVIAAIIFWFLAPAEWKERVGLIDQRPTPLQLMMTHSDRQRLASGNELLAISGRVINPTEKRQTVPPITAQLRDAKGKLVYSWTIAPPAPSLKGGDSASFYSAEVNVPAGGDELTVTLGAPKKAG